MKKLTLNLKALKSLTAAQAKTVVGGLPKNSWAPCI